jgi:hypothetical protein
MASTFPDINVPPSQRNLSWGKAMIDAAIGIHESASRVRTQMLQLRYDSYNGIRPSIAKKYITEKYGHALSQKYIDYHLGRTKVKVLLGEALKINLNPTVRTVNPQAVTKKMSNMHKRVGIALNQSRIAAINKKFGFDLPEIPEQELSTFLNMAPKEVNELNMQRIINKKMKTERVMTKGYSWLTDIILTSECHGKVERDPYGNDTLRIISPMDSLFQETPGDDFVQKSPFKGEKRKMYIHDILQTFPNLTETEVKLLKDASINPQLRTDVGVVQVNGMSCCEVYTIQWKCPRTYYEKVSTNKKSPVPYQISISDKYYEEHAEEIENDVAYGKYGINRYYGEDLYEITRIGKDIYTDFGRVKNQIQRRGPNGKYHACYDYLNLCFGTINGSRIPLQEVIDNLSEVYNVIMFMINRELKKMKGMVFSYDKSATPKGEDLTSIIYKITEHGILLTASSEDQNISGKDIDNLDKLIRVYDLSVSKGFTILLELKTQVEFTIDRITGINENREGLGKASQTATGSLNNIEASRSITQDIFYFWTLYMEEVITALAEKTKTNWDFLDSDNGELLLGSAGLAYAKAAKNMTDDDYSVQLTDGKLELEIKERARIFMQADINSQQLRTKDVIRFELAETLSEGLAVLDTAWQEIEAINNKKYENEQQVKNQQIQGQLEIAREDREDRQAHEIQRDVIKEEERRKTKAMELGAKSAVESDKIDASRNINKK